jgi:diguanylate cyclase (GGDEF)-like protein
MMDIDHFKAVNDRYGHQVGDATLVTFVERTRDVLRVPDVLGRLGGEEFCALLVGSSLTQATTIAERIRAAVEAGSIDLDNGELHVTVSIGVAEFGPDGTSIEAVIGAADDRLYRAKALGRNCVVS